MALSEHRLHILDLALAEVRAEVVRAIEKFPTFNSAHEGYAVIPGLMPMLWRMTAQMGIHRDYR